MRFHPKPKCILNIPAFFRIKKTDKNERDSFNCFLLSHNAWLATVLHDGQGVNSCLSGRFLAKIGCNEEHTD